MPGRTASSGRGEGGTIGPAPPHRRPGPPGTGNRSAYHFFLLFIAFAILTGFTFTQEATSLPFSTT